MDNGHGVLSECDFILLDKAEYDIERVFPTYYLDCGVFDLDGILGPCHVAEVGVDVVVVRGGSSAETGAWGTIKAIFARIL